jgi:hypothetical protein
MTAALKAEVEKTLRIIEDTVVTERPSAVILQAEKSTVSPVFAASGFTALSNEQLSFGAGINRRTTPVGSQLYLFLL